MKNHLIKITETIHTLFIILSLCIILTSCGNPSAGSGVPVFFADVKAVSAGSEHTVAIKTDGSLWAWGFNQHGQLGDGTTINSNAPVQIGTDKWLAVSVGYNHTVAIKTDGSLWAWGNNTSGQLGDGTTDQSNTPVPIIGTNTPNIDWIAISAGGNHTVAIKNDGSIWAWGNNASGQLGISTSSLIPVQISSTNTPNTDWAAVSAGGSYTVAIKNDGSIWAWGNNFQGQLGGDTGGDTRSLTPIALKGTGSDGVDFKDYKWKTVSAGQSHTVAIKNDGSIWAWGNNDDGQLGDASTTDSPIPVQIGTDTDWAAVSVGQSHTVAVKNDGSLWAWGANYDDQLGDPGISNLKIPNKIGDRWRVVPTGESHAEGLSHSAGSYHTVAIKRDGVLWSWGTNEEGQLGNASTTNSPTPTRVIESDW